MSDDAKVKETPPSQPQVDPYRAAIEGTSRTIKLHQLFYKYAGDLSERDQLAFVGLLKSRYETAVQNGEQINDEKFFQEIRDMFKAPESEESPEEKVEEEAKETASESKQTEEEKPKPQASPQGKHEAKGVKDTKPPVTPLEESEYIYADDEKYFQAREELFNKIRSFKPRTEGARIVVPSEES